METFLGLLGTGANLLFQWMGLGKAEEQAAKTLKYQERMSREALRRSDIRFGKEYKLKKEVMAETKKERAKTWEWKEEERNYGRGQNMVNRFMGLLAADPVAKDRLMMTWNSARIK